MDGLKVYATTSVLPPADDLSVVLSAAGADLVREVPDEKPSNPNAIVIIGNPADKDEIKSLSDRGYNIQSVEFILRGVLQQKVDYKRYSL